MAPSRNSHDRAVRLPAALGVLAASALLLTALADFGDPMRAARGEIELGAAARADAVRATWSRIRANSDGPEAWGALASEPPGTAESLAIRVPDEVPEFARGHSDKWDESVHSGGERAPVAAALQRSARALHASGDFERAEELARGAALRAETLDSSLFARIQLDRMRWASAGARQAEVLELRAELVEKGADSARLGQTSALLLAALVEPLDPRLALQVLADDPRALPRPEDRLRVTGQGFVLRSDPWWSTLEERLTQAAPELDWAAAFHREARQAEALRAFFGGHLGGLSDRWTFTRRSERLFAVRRDANGTRVVPTSESDLASVLRTALGSAEPQPYRVQFDHEPSSGAEQVRDREWLDGTSIGFTVHRADPYRAGRAEAARLSAIRVGLVLLAVAIACATLLGVRAARRTRRLEQMRSTFVASVSHDLRTPIQSILLMSETLERGRVAGEASRSRYFATIRQEAHRLRRFVEDVLDSARLDRGEVARVERQALESEPFFAKLEQDLRDRAERDQARLEFVRGSLPESLELDPDGTLRIVWNLFENALRHGRVVGEPTEVRVEVQCESGVLAVTIQDSGPGVPAKYASSIFEPFERGGAEQGGPSGTGLGLSIVRALARAHGGDAELMPTDRGACFQARLAVSPSDQEGDPAA